VVRRVGPWSSAGAPQREAMPTEEPEPPDEAPSPGAVDGSPPGPTNGARRFRLACLAGGLVGLLPHLALLTGGGFSERNLLGGFYDAQAHSLLDLRWDVPAEALSVEAFVVHGKAYTYFGPTPALLRLPVAALTDRFDGRLTAASLLLAAIVTVVALADLAWRVRRLVAGERPAGGGELLGFAAFSFLLAAGSSLLFLSSAPVVYHEAIAWGVALALGADAALLAYLARRRPSALAAASVLATLAVLARPSVGLGPVLALGFLLAADLLGVVRAGRGSARPHPLGPLAVAAVVPVVLYAAVNLAKFDSVFGVPWRAQALSQFDPARQAFLRDSGGSLFGPEYAPTTLLQYVRPDALSLNRSFPWLDFPGPADRLFDVPFDVIDRCSSLVVTMPWLVLLAVAGTVALVARRSPGARRAAAALWAPGLGALAATPVTVGIAYIASRYLADFVPLLVLPALAGLALLLDRPGPGRRRVLVLGAIVATAVAVPVNAALALQYQGLYGPATREEQRARLVRWQTRADELLPGDQSPTVFRVGRDEPLPTGGRAGELLVVGSCAALYQHDGAAWRPVEQTEEAGRLRVRTRLGAPGRGAAAELLAGGNGGDRRSLTIEIREDGRAVFVLRIGDRTKRGAPVEVPSGDDVVDAVFDRRLNSVAVWVDDRVVVGDTFYGAPDDELRVASSWPAPVTRLPYDAPACQGLGD
jgi:hypothetical protein